LPSCAGDKEGFGGHGGAEKEMKRLEIKSKGWDINICEQKALQARKRWTQGQLMEISDKLIWIEMKAKAQLNERLYTSLLHPVG
jgi:hypothetical protein